MGWAPRRIEGEQVSEAQQVSLRCISPFCRQFFSCWRWSLGNIVSSAKDCGEHLPSAWPLVMNWRNGDKRDLLFDHSKSHPEDSRALFKYVDFL